jgi:hypothetical protein
MKEFLHKRRRWTWHHITVFLLTFLLYALYHSSRKAFSNVKDVMAKSLSPSEQVLYPSDVWQKEGICANYGRYLGRNIDRGRRLFFLMKKGGGFFVGKVRGEVFS